MSELAPELEMPALRFDDAIREGVTSGSQFQTLQGLVEWNLTENMDKYSLLCTMPKFIKSTPGVTGCTWPTGPALPVVSTSPTVSHVCQWVISITIARGTSTPGSVSSSQLLRAQKLTCVENGYHRLSQHSQTLDRCPCTGLTGILARRGLGNQRIRCFSIYAEMPHRCLKREDADTILHRPVGLTCPVPNPPVWLGNDKLSGMGELGRDHGRLVVDTSNG